METAAIRRGAAPLSASTFSRMMAPALTDLEEAERSIESTSLLLADHITAQCPAGGGEDVTLWGIVELLDVNRDRLRAAREFIETLREETALTGESKGGRVGN